MCGMKDNQSMKPEIHTSQKLNPKYRGINVDILIFITFNWRAPWKKQVTLSSAFFRNCERSFGTNFADYWTKCKPQRKMSPTNSSFHESWNAHGPNIQHSELTGVGLSNPLPFCPRKWPDWVVGLPSTIRPIETYSWWHITELLGEIFVNDSFRPPHLSEKMSVWRSNVFRPSRDQRLLYSNSHVSEYRATVVQSIDLYRGAWKL